MKIPDSLTNEEMRELGMDPEVPFATCQREDGKPFDVRFGDSRIVRSDRGCVAHYIGYYSEAQQRARSLVGKLIFEKMKMNGFFTG